MGILSGGIGSGMACLGMGGLITGLYVVITGRRSWARLAGRKFGVLALVGGLIFFVAGTSIYSATHPKAAASSQTKSEPAASSVPAPDVTKSEVPKPADPAPEAPAATPAPVAEPVPAPAPVAEKAAPAAPAPAVAPPPAAAPAPSVVTYKNCDAVKAAGKSPLLNGQPGYSTKLDKDGDGVACEK